MRAANPKEDTPKPKEQPTRTCQTVTTKKTSRLQTPTKSSPICRIRVARCGSQTRHRRHAPVIMLPQKTSSMQTPTNSGPSCRIRLARCGSHTGHLNPKASQTRTCQTVTPKKHPACKRRPTPAQAAASESRAADPKEDTSKPGGWHLALPLVVSAACILEILQQLNGSHSTGLGLAQANGKNKNRKCRVSCRVRFS